MGFDPFTPVGKINETMDIALSTGDIVRTALDSCIGDLAKSIAGTLSATQSSTAETQRLLALLTAPFNEAAEAFKALFLPDPSVADDAEGFLAQVGSFAESIVSAAMNPIAALIQAQVAALKTSGEASLSILLNGATNEPGKGVATQVYDRLSATIMALIMDTEKGGFNLAGMLWIALGETLPNIEMELSALRRLKGYVRRISAEASTTPTSMEGAVSGTIAALQLCEAEEKLRRVGSVLRQEGRWDRAEFSAAKQHICTSRDILKDGIIPADLRGFVQSSTGWSDRQLNAFINLKFAPDVRFWSYVALARKAEQTAYNADLQIIPFHQNLRRLLGDLKVLTTLKVGDLLGLLVDILRRQIQILRADLETGSQTADIFTTMGTQAGGYIALEALCRITGTIERMQGSLQKVIDMASGVFKIIADFLNYYSATDCGPDDGGTVVRQRMTDFLKAVENRVNGKGVSDEVLQYQQGLLITAIEGHEKFLACIRDRMFLGKDDVIGRAVQIGQIIAAAKQILAMAKQLPGLIQTIRSMSVSQMLGVESTTAIATMIKALQCLIFNCNNGYLFTVANAAVGQLGPELGKSQAVNLSIAALGEAPTKARSDAANGKINAIMRLIKAIQRLMSLGLNDLCNVDVTAAPSSAPRATGSTGAVEEASEDSPEAARARAEQAAQGSPPPRSTDSPGHRAGPAVYASD